MQIFSDELRDSYHKNSILSVTVPPSCNNKWLKHWTVRNYRHFLNAKTFTTAFESSWLSLSCRACVSKVKKNKQKKVFRSTFKVFTIYPMIISNLKYTGETSLWNMFSRIHRRRNNAAPYGEWKTQTKRK
jgi:hypothetical protein